MLTTKALQMAYQTRLLTANWSAVSLWSGKPLHQCKVRWIRGQLWWYDAKHEPSRKLLG
jgi:hypothetical protein